MYGEMDAESPTAGLMARPFGRQGARPHSCALAMTLSLGCFIAVFSCQAKDSPKASITEAVQAGLYRCHQGTQVVVKNIASDLGSIVVRFRGRDHLLFAIDTETGAVRYQDKRSGMTWIKIPSKSMLLDSKLGRPLANDCRL